MLRVVHELVVDAQSPLRDRAGPTFLSTINYLIPVVAFFCGVWLLSEPVGWLHYLSLVTILCGIAMTRYRATPTQQ